MSGNTEARLHHWHPLRDLNAYRPIALVIVVVLALTGIPYFYGYLSCPSDKQFMGILLNVPDNAQYLSWARESANALFIENKMTPEPGNAMFFNLYWLIVGRLAKLLGLGYAEGAQVMRPLAGALYLIAIYWFVGLFAGNRLQRWISFFVISLGGGLGWLLVVSKQFTAQLAYPLDLYVTESNTFLSVMAFPLQAASGGLLVLILGLSVLAFERNSLRVAAAAGLLALVLGLQHAYDLLIVYAVLGIVAAVLALRDGFNVRPMLLYSVVGMLSAPPAIYLAYLTSHSPIWRGVLAQYGNAGVYTPSPVHLLILMGLPLVLVIGVGVPLIVRRAVQGQWRRLLDGDARELLLWSWLLIGFVLLYIPTDFQIKMLGGWQIPVGIWATRMLRWNLIPALQRGFPRIRRLDAVALLLFLVAVLPTNLYLYAWRFVDLGRGDYPYYLYKDEVAAMRWLELNARRSDVVLSSLTIGQYVPAVTGDRAFLAHWAQTLDFFGKRQMVASFFDQSNSDRERLGLITRFNVRYVLFTDQERAIGAYEPGRADYLTRVFASPNASIYEIQDHPEVSAGR